MVTLEVIRASNQQIASTLPSGLVAVFVGGTNGVGEATVRRFVRYAKAPRVYLIGRSREAGTRIINECKALNGDANFTFISKDTSLLRNVDDICAEIKQNENSINLLFLTIGTLQTGITTSEGLHYPAALAVHARNRFISNLLPLLENATSLRRVISVFVGALEGEIQLDNLQGWNMKLMANRGHAASITTLILEAHHKASPNVSFVHNFPGMVKGGITRGTSGALLTALKAFMYVLGSFLFMPPDEAGDRHVFLATSARYSNGLEDTAAGIPLSAARGLSLARGTDGKDGSGVYSIDVNGDSAGPKVEELLESLRSSGTTAKVVSIVRAETQEAIAAGTKV